MYMNEYLRKQSIRGSTASCHWRKVPLIIPILKQGKPRTEPSSYRPISLTSHVDKVLGKTIIWSRLAHYCGKKTPRLIPVNQEGVRKCRSTIDQLVKLTTHVKKQFARKKSTPATFFDVRKAYDKVWHARLLFKLKYIGLSGNIYSYPMSNRSIQRRVRKSLSSTKSVNIGFTQGSNIAPILLNTLH